MTVKLITFDLDNTLWENDQVIAKAEQAYYRSLEEQIPELTSVYNADQLAQQRFLFASTNPHLQSQISELRKQSLQVLLNDFLEDQNKINDIVKTAFDCFYQARNSLRPFPETLPLLQTLKQNYILGALTNGNSCLATIGIKHFFKISFSAEQVGSRKPDPEMFIAAMNAANTNPEETLHIGDHPLDDIYGAQQLGIKTIWFNPSQQEWSSLSDEQPASAEIKSLPEIIALLENQQI